ncbi:hypothetical protein [Planococcus lenghuensis]|uniref:Lipoprotein n=1 Tax=Planococcus lenghuensis TaxID=2213202 RepID=A0A1Q2KY59_9BACL|nr:hypothetical protein [Planococcus lenghuensis]AQQ53148.1 hypothetical protein B0X71_08620 [Planococcus lenghuensis]
MKRVHSLVVLICLLMALTSCNSKPMTIVDFYEGSLENITEISILDGRTGEEVRTVDSAVIDAFLQDIQSIQFVPEKDQSAREGYLYSIRFFEGDSETFRFTPIEVEGNYYETEPDIHPVISQYAEEFSLE